MRVALHLAAPSAYDGALTLLRRADMRVTSYADAEALLAGLEAGPLPDVVVTGLHDARGRPAAALVGQLQHRHPSVPVVAYGVPVPALAEAFLAVARHGLAEAALHGIDDLAAVVRRVAARASTHSVAEAALAMVGPQLGPTTRPIVRYCLVHAHESPAVQDVAAALAVSRKTVAARLAAEALPPASALVGWGRVLLAARWLEDSRRSGESVAHALGFADGTGLRHLVARYTRLRTEEVRARGGLSSVLPLFAAAIDAGAQGGSRARRAVLSTVPAALAWMVVGLADVDWNVAITATLLG